MILINYTFFFFCRILREIFYSLHSVIDKYVMEKKFGSVYELISTNGIIILSFFVIFGVFNYYYIRWMDDYEEYFSNFNYKELLVILGVMITQLGLNLCILFTNRDNSPCHIFIIFIFGQLAFCLNFTGVTILVLLLLILILFFHWCLMKL